MLQKARNIRRFMSQLYLKKMRHNMTQINLARLSACSGMNHNNVMIGNTTLPISRKYKETVQQYLKQI